MEQLELKYMVFSINEVNMIDFMDVMDESIETLNKSNDGLKVYVKWERDGIPSSIDALETKEGPYNQAEMNEILGSAEWMK